MTGHHDGSEPTIDDDQLFLAVGHAIAAGASLEWSIVELHATLLHSPRALQALAGEGVDRARDGCLHMAQIVGTPVGQLVREALEPVKDLWRQRNALVHSAWMAGSHLGNPARSGITIRLRRNGVATDGWSVESINRLTNQLANCGERIGALARRLEDEHELAHAVSQSAPPFQICPTNIW